MLFHLIMNSIKFAKKKDSKILIKLTYRPFSREHDVPDGWVGFLETKVIDNGLGIAIETQKTLFHTFKEKYLEMKHGVGIGLSTVRAIAEALCGEVKLRSQLGEGTKVCFTMPVSIKKQSLSQGELHKHLGGI